MQKKLPVYATSCRKQSKPLPEGGGSSVSPSMQKLSMHLRPSIALTQTGLPPAPQEEMQLAVCGGDMQKLNGAGKRCRGEKNNNLKRTADPPESWTSSCRSGGSGAYENQAEPPEFSFQDEDEANKPHPLPPPVTHL